MDLFTKPTPDTVWTNPLKADARELSWRMRYSRTVGREDIATLNHELMLGASFMDNYAALILMPERRRNKVIAALKADAQRPAPQDGGKP